MIDTGEFENNSLRNLEWWDGVDVSTAMCQRVATWEGVHPSQAQGLEEVKTTIMQAAWGAERTPSPRMEAATIH